MTNYLLVIGVAVLGGIAVVLQAQFNSIMDKGMGTLESVFITYGIGGLLVGLLMLTFRVTAAEKETLWQKLQEAKFEELADIRVEI